MNAVMLDIARAYAQKSREALRSNRLRLAMDYQALADSFLALAGR